MSEKKGGRPFLKNRTRCKPVYLDYFSLYSINETFSTFSTSLFAGEGPDVL